MARTSIAYRWSRDGSMPKAQHHEQIWDVAVSGDRKIEADGRCKTPVGNTVNVPDASYTKHHRRADVTWLLEGS